jgi:hypothetical protein
MMTLMKDDNTGLPKSLGISFYFNDVIEYLELNPQPLLFKDQMGFVGGSTFVINYQNKLDLLRFIQTRLKSKEIKTKKKMIADPILLDQFLNENLTTKHLKAWTVHQDINTYDLIVSRGRMVDSLFAYSPVVKIPSSSMPQEQSDQTTYSWLLPNLSFDYLSDLDLEIGFTEIDSLDPLPIKPVQLKPASGKFFIEGYNALLNESNQSSKSIVPEIWKQIAKAFGENQLTIHYPINSLYPCHYNWSGTTLDFGDVSWTPPPHFSLNPDDAMVIDKLDTPSAFRQITIGYKRWITDFGSESKFEPFEISILYKIDSGPVLKTITVRWPDLKKILSSDIKFDPFISSVENASLQFHSAQVLYGLIEVK